MNLMIREPPPYGEGLSVGMAQTKCAFEVSRLCEMDTDVMKCCKKSERK